MFQSTIVLFFILLTGCLNTSQDSGFKGFWEGPHPENPDKKFYIHIDVVSDSVSARGYWTENNFYQSKFDVEQMSLSGDEIRFYIPMWNCYYTGKRAEPGLIKGGFECEGEPFDSVQLSKNTQIAKYLVYPKPGCNNQNYQYGYTLPENKNDGMKVPDILNAADTAFTSTLVNEIIAGKYGRINSFLVYKEGRLIGEEYFYGYTRNDVHQIESCTKSVTSLLVGIAVGKGWIEDVKEPLYRIFPEYPHLKTGNYKKITIENLLTMQSGFEPENDRLFESENRTAFALNRKLTNEPGTTFQYDGGNTEILGAILYRKTGMFVDDFAQKYLFRPLDIEQFLWERFNNREFPLMSGSLCLLPRDMIKLGALVLNGGNYAGVQVIPENWVASSTAVKTGTHIPGDNYSYQWWNLTLESKGKKYKVIWANGWGSQFIYILPEIKAVIVTTGHNYEYDSWAITAGIEKYLFLLDTEPDVLK